MSLSILGWGTALPAHSISQAQAAKAAVSLNGLTAQQARLVPILYRRCGVKARASVLLTTTPKEDAGTQKIQSFFLPANTPDDKGPTTEERMAQYVRCALPLALRASAEALRTAGIFPAAITHLVTVSCSGFSAPGVDIGLMRELGLPPTTQRTHVGFMGCHGALNGLRVANAFSADPAARVLVCAVELCSLHYQYGWNPDRIVSNALFADGSAAVVGAPEAAATQRQSWRVQATGSCLFPGSEEAMTWRIGNHGFAMTLSARVPDLIGAHLRPWIEGWLGGQGLNLGGIRSWAVHPGGPRILQAVEEALELDPATTATSREVLAECGNMSSPTILFILDRMARRCAPRPCVALGFGPGLVAEAILFM